MAIQRIRGNWVKGFALDLHTKSSVYLGLDEFGIPRFDNTRTEIGELVYRLKYKQDNSVIPYIINQICIIGNLNKMDIIIPAPPSKERVSQPVFLIAEALGERLGIPVLANEVIKVKNTAQIKNVIDPAERKILLQNAFNLSGNTNLIDKTILVIDDLFRSGATLEAITTILYKYGGVKEVYVLALTKTRSLQ